MDALLENAIQTRTREQAAQDAADRAHIPTAFAQYRQLRARWAYQENMRKNRHRKEAAEYLRRTEEMAQRLEKAGLGFVLGARAATADSADGDMKW